MGCGRLRVRGVFMLAAIVVLALTPSLAEAQGGFGGGGFGGGGGGFGGGGGGFGGGQSGQGGASNQDAGVVIDASGVLRVQTFVRPGGALGRQRIQAARAAVNPKLAKPNAMRKISLTRLEAAVAKQLKEGSQLPDEMKYLAGLLRIQYVFFYPETGDIVIAGPAEGYFTDAAGRVRGLASGRPVVELQDLIVALRAFPPAGDKTNVISVSIDPTQEGLARMKQFLVSIAGRVGPGDANSIAAGLRNSLGQQIVSIKGISPATHFAQVLVEADYRMKLIGIGLEASPIKKIGSYVNRAKPRNVSRNALQRWYFTPNYECVRVTQDDTAMELVGWGVRLIGEAEMVLQDGGRVVGSAVDRASDTFCKAFTENYPMLANVRPVYAQLRNLIDLSVAAAFIQQKDYYGQNGWNLGVFADEQALPVEVYDAPTKVESAVNVVWKGHTLMTPIGGGVNIQPLQALDHDKLMKDEEGEVAKAQQKIQLQRLSEGQWWWD